MHGRCATREYSEILTHGNTNVTDVRIRDVQ